MTWYLECNNDERFLVSTVSVERAAVWTIAQECAVGRKV